MIKCEVEACAKITRAAVVKPTKDGGVFLSFGVIIPIKGHNGETKNLEISVSADGDKSKKGIFSEGRKVKLSGTLTIRKKAGVVYYNLRAEGGAELCKSTEPTGITGTMNFRGKVGHKGIEEKMDKKDNPFIVFSAFSSDKDGENKDFTWVRFLYFNPKDNVPFLKADAYILVNGELLFGVYKDNICIDCKVNEVTPWELESKE